MAKPELVKTSDRYNFWRLTDGKTEYWNITPKDQEPPLSGYKNKSYIENVKGAKF